jgi:glycosyltransferase involved in cell wall biosynthesis
MKNLLRIGFDISQAGPGKAGCGYFADALVKALLNQNSEYKFSLYTNFGDFYFNPSMSTFRDYGDGVDYGRSYSNYEEAKQFWFKENLETELGNPDLIHSNNFWCPNQLKKSKLIYTLYDLSFALYPEFTTEANRVGCFEGVFKASIFADWIVAISESSRQDFIRMFPHFPAHRIEVIYPSSRFNDSLDMGTKPSSIGSIQPKQFLLSVGTIEPRKNQKNLLRAYSLYKKTGARFLPLIFAGGSGWLMDDFLDFIKELGLENDVHVLGYVTDRELIWLYRNCYVNLYSSLFEGFGLPVIEGMQFGAPSIVSNVSSMPEAAGSAAIMLSPEDIKGWGDAIASLVNDELRSEDLRVASLNQSMKFAWNDSAKKLFDLYARAIENPKRGGVN